MASVASPSVGEASLFAHTDIQFHSAVYGGGTNAGHACIDILKHERMSLKGDTFVGKLQRMVVAIDGEIVIKVKTSGFGIDKELNGRTVTDRKETRGEDSRTIPNKKAARLSGLNI